MTRGNRTALTLATAICALAGLPSRAALADDPPKFELTIKDHRFSPAEIHVPAGTRTVITVRNEDDTPEEFDSSSLQVEKVVMGGRWGLVRLNPLAPGRYPFMGEYHPDTARGVVVAEEGAASPK